MNVLDWLDRLPRRQLLTLVFLGALAGNVAAVVTSKGNQPPKPGDGVDYDSIAFALVHGHGYARYSGHPDFQTPYLNAQDAERVAEYTQMFQHAGPPAPTAYRPPGLPLMLAGIYGSVGRHFMVWRLVNATFIALAVTLAASLAFRLAGQWAAIFCGIIGAADPSLKRYAGNLLAEGMAMLMVVLLAWALVKLFEHRSMLRAALVGLTLGVMVLVRSIFLIWLPLTLAAAAFLWTWPHRSARRVVPATALLLGAALLAPSPWWARNVIALDAFMPTGTQGGIGLPGGYSDQALANSGFWISATDHVPELVKAKQELHASNRTPLRIERDLSRAGTAFVIGWMADNPVGVLKLMALKGYHLWTRPSTIQGLIFACLGLLGVRWCWRRRDAAALVPWLLIGFNMLAAMATYVTHGGRFIVAVLPMLHIVGAIGLWRLIDHFDHRDKAVADA